MTPLGDGQACSTSAECQNGACLPTSGGNSICCHTGCTDQGGSSCGTNGQCQPDGSACAMYDPTTPCSQCTNGMLATTCDGQGNCAGTIATCYNGTKCASATACLPTCASDSDCQSPSQFCQSDSNACVEHCGTATSRCIFMPSSEISGSIGGLSGADDYCNSFASDAKISGTYMAWLSDSDGSPATRFEQANVPYIRTDGVLVAANWTQLTSGTLLAPPCYTERRGEAFGLPVFTNTKPDGTPLAGGSSCMSWGDATAGDLGSVGNNSFVDGRWTDNSATVDCSVGAAIYCVEQGSPCGAAMACGVASDCTSTPPTCQVNACMGGCCTTAPAAPETSCGGGMVCDGAGNCVACVSVSDCAPSCTGGQLSQPTCTGGTCSLGSPVACANNYNCASATACATACATNADCATGPCNACPTVAKLCLAPLGIGDCVQNPCSGSTACGAIGSFGVGSEPVAIASDGTNMWVTNAHDGTLSKVSPSGTASGPFGGLSFPSGIAFDGTNMWVANSNANNVVEFAPDGSVVGSYGVGAHPAAIAFDGANMWTANLQDGTVTKLPITGQGAQTFTIGGSPYALAFDGTNMWVADPNESNVHAVSPTGTVLGPYAVGGGPSALAFDGTNMWVANMNTNNVSVLSLTGALVGTYSVGSSPQGIAFDGTNMWVSNYQDNTVTELSPSGASLGTFGVGPRPIGIAFDGTHMWTANSGGSTVTEL